MIFKNYHFHNVYNEKKYQYFWYFNIHTNAYRLKQILADKETQVRTVKKKFW